MLYKKSLASLKHRITLCRQEDVVVSPSEFRLARKEAASFWAEVAPVRSSAFSVNGAAMNEARSILTHRIKIRYQYDLNVSIMAWIYEARLQSSARWFKILKVTQTENKDFEYLIFDCRLVERGDDIVAPSNGPVVGLPSGVRL